MRQLRPLATVLPLVTILAGCGMSAPAPDTSQGTLLKSDLPRDPSPSVTPDDRATLAKGNTAFAQDLYRQLAKDGENLFFSPYSVTVALAMAQAGARGETATEMNKTLHFDLPNGRLHGALNALDMELGSRGEGAKSKDGAGFRLRITNSTWTNVGTPFEKPYLDLLARNYGAGLHLVDFEHATDAARSAINSWTSNATESRIPELLGKEALSPLTRLVLVNAVYFNGGWRHPFHKESTRAEGFTRFDGSKVTVPTMHQTESLGYGEGDGYQAVALPYDDTRLSLVILLPTGKLGAFEASLDGAKIAAIEKSLASQPVALSLPKFALKGGTVSLTPSLRALGMRKAFADADFSGMTTAIPLYIADVLHQAFVSVDEDGTEAAAATAVIADLGSAAPETPKVMTVNRPFVVLLRDTASGTTLFAGHVATL